MSQDSTPFRFSLRSLLIAVALTAIGCTFWPTYHSENAHSLQFQVAAAVVTTSGALMAHAAGSIGAHIVRSILTQRTFRLVGWLLLGTLVVATGYLLWAHERWVDFPDYLDDPLYPRSFPFPDQILGKYEAWLDMRNPPAPNQFKIHGEIYTVMEHLRGLIFACVMMAFFLSGLLLPKLSTKLRHMVKMSFRHERIPD